MRQIKATMRRDISRAHTCFPAPTSMRRSSRRSSRSSEKKTYRWSMYATNSGGSPSSFVVVDWGTIERIPNDCRNKRVDTAQLISSLGNAAAIFDKAQRYDIKVQQGEWY